MASKTVSAKKYSNLQSKYKNLKTTISDLQAKLDNATSSQKVMQQNLDNAYGKVQQYQAMEMDLKNRYLDLEEDAIFNAAQAQREANEFNASEAQKQRDWSEAMSATAHQREVKDLQAAGLNPVISAFGSGASVGSGAAASSSNNLTGAYAGIAQQALSAVSQLAQAMETNSTSYAKTVMEQTIAARGQDINYVVNTYAADLSSKTNLSINQATNQMNKYIAELNNSTSKKNAEIAAAANKYSADAHLTAAKVSAAASNYSAELAYQATYYSANKQFDTEKMKQLENRMTQDGITNRNNETAMATALIHGVASVFGGVIARG